jgi:hypothetical protein
MNVDFCTVLSKSLVNILIISAVASSSTFGTARYFLTNASTIVFRNSARSSSSM